MAESLPKTKAELLGRIQTAREELEATLEGLSDDQLAAPGLNGGWAIKDHLVHLAAWQRKVLSLMSGGPPHEALGVGRATYDSGNEDVINAVIHERWQACTAADALATFHGSYDGLLAALRDLSDADLTGPYAPGDPTDARRLVDGIAANSYQHDAEHTGWIRAQLRR